MGKFYLIILMAAFLSACSGTKEDVAKSVKFENFTKDTVCYISSSTNAPSLKVRVEAELPVTCPNVELLSQMQKLVGSAIIGHDTTAIVPDKTLGMYVQKCVNDYKSLEKEYNIIKDTLAEGNIVPNSFNWEIGLKGVVSYSDKGILCYQTEKETFTDGEHRSNFINCYNISVVDGHIIGLNDIFDDNYEEIITPSIISKLKEQYKSDNLSSIGFFDEDEICPSQNFSIDNEGITFIYNPGDIALKGLGGIKVNLSFQELTVVVKPESFIMEFVK